MQDAELCRWLLEVNEPWEVSRVRVDTRLPLLADYCAAMVKVSIQSQDREPGLGYCRCSPG